MDKLLKSPNSPHRDRGVLSVVVLDAIAEVLVPREASAVLGGTPIVAITETANDDFLLVQ